MNTAATLLHDMRGQQLRALVKARDDIRHTDRASVDLWAGLCGAQYDTRNLSDKALEEVDALAGKYLERAR